jgi:hypothetical protein
MPWDSEELAKKFGQSAADLKQNLDSLGNSAEGADKAFAKMMEHQEQALKIEAKFDKAMAGSTKVMSAFGRSGATAVRNLRAVDTVSKSTASSLGAVGAGAVSAASGFRSLSSEAVSFTSDMSGAEKSVAGLVTVIEGLDKKITGISASNVSINVMIGGTKAIDDLEQRIKALPSNINIGVGSSGSSAGGGVSKPVKMPGRKPTDSMATPTLRPIDAKRVATRIAKEETTSYNAEYIKGVKKSTGPLNKLENARKAKIRAGLVDKTPPSFSQALGDPSDKKGKDRGAQAAQDMVDSFAQEFKWQMESTISMAEREIDTLQATFDKTGTGRDVIIKLSVEAARDTTIKDYIEDLEDSVRAGAQKAWKEFMIDVMNSSDNGAQAIESLKKKFPELGMAVEKNMFTAKKAAEGLTSQMAYLEAQMNKESKSFGDLFKKSFAEGGVEASKFGDGLAANATGMMAAGLAGAFLATKIGDLAKKYADTALGVAKFNTAISSTERTIIGMNKGSLNEMRKQLYLSRDQASAFFDVVKKGVNDLGMSQAKIMDVAKALRSTFGGDQTERLKQYVDLLESIPTLETDLKITANMDDQAAAIFALAEAGKMEAVVDLQTAGLLGGQKQKMPGADMANAQQKTAAVMEGIQDFLVNKMFPEWGFALSEIVDGTTAAVAGVLAAVGVIGGLTTLTASAAASNLASREVATGRIVNALQSSQAGGGKLPPQLPGVGKAGSGLSKLGGTALKTAKGIGIIAVATFALEAGFTYLENKAIKAGNVVGEAEASIGKSAVTIAGLAATGFLFGNVIGAAIGATAGLVMEFGNLSKSIPTFFNELFGKDETQMSQGMENNDAKQRGMQTRMVKSGIELQRTLKQIDLVAKNAKNSLYKMQKETAQVKIGNLQDIGGSADGFNSALNSATTATTKQYQMQSSAFAKARADIMANAGMEASERRHALEVLNKNEMEATRNFVDGINSVVDALFKTPGIIQAGLKAEIAGTMLDFADMGGMNSGQIKSAADAQAAALEDKLNQVFSSASDAAEKTSKTIEELNKKREMSEQNIFDLISETDRKQAQGTKQVGELEARRRVVELKHQLDMAKNPSMTEGLGTQVGAGAIGAVAGGMIPIPGLSVAAADFMKRKAKEDQKLKNEQKIRTLEAEVTDAMAQVNVEEAKQVAEAEMSARLKKAMVIDKKTGKKKIDVKAAKEVMDETAKEQDRVSAELEAAQKEVGSTFGASLAKNMNGAAKAVIEAQKRAEEAASDLSSADVGKRVAATNEKKLADETLNEAKTNLAKLQDEMNKQLRGMAVELGDDEINGIVQKLSSAGMSVGDMENEFKKYGKLWDEINKSTERNSAAIGNMDYLKAQKNSLDKTEMELRNIVEAETGITMALQNGAKSVQEIRDATQKVIDAQMARWKLFDEDVWNSQRTVSAMARTLKAESLVGDGIDAQANLAEAEIDMSKRKAESYRKSADLQEMSLPILKKQLENAERSRKYFEDIYNQTPDGETDAEKATKAGAKGMVDTAVAKELGIQQLISAGNQIVDEARNAAMEAAEALGQSGEMISRAFKALEESAAGIRLKNYDEYAQILVDTAEYAGTVADASKKSFQIAKAVANKRYEEEKRAAEKGREEDRAANVERLKTYMDSDEAKKVTDPGQKKALEDRKAAELEATTQSTYQLKSAETELKLKKSVAEAGQRSKELKEREIDIQQGLIDDAMSFASDFGGSFAAVMELQQVNVGLARQQLDAAKEYRDQMVAAGHEGLDLQEAQADVIQKQLNVRRKELGIQKDMMERLLGGVFGELNTSFGARRGLLSDQAVLGTDATRMKTASGMFMNTPGGEPGTIDDRAAKRMTSGMGMGGVWEKSGSPEVAGVMGDVLKALNSTPKKTPLEEAAAKAAAATAESTEDTANNTAAGTKPGSLYTHDITAEDHAITSEGYLAGILNVLKELTVGVLSGEGIGKSESKGVKTDKVDLAISKGKKDADDNGKKVADGVRGLAKVSVKTSESTKDSDKTLGKSLVMEKKMLQLVKKGPKADKTGEQTGGNSSQAVGLIQRYTAKAELDRSDEEVEAAETKLSKAQFARKGMRSVDEMTEQENGLKNIRDSKLEVWKTARSPENKAKAEKEYDLAANKASAAQDRNTDSMVDLPRQEEEARKKVSEAKEKRAQKMRAFEETLAGGSAKVGSVTGGASMSGMVRAFKGPSMIGMSSSADRERSKSRFSEGRNSFSGQAKLGGGKFTGGAVLGGGRLTGGASLGGSSAIGGMSLAGAKGGMVSKPGSTITGSMTAIGGTSSGSQVAKRASGAGTDTMASKAAGTAVAPPLTGTQVASSGGVGGSGMASSEGVACTMTGELSVKFDNRMFESAVTTVVGKIMFSAENVTKMKKTLFA